MQTADRLKFQPTYLKRKGPNYLIVNVFVNLQKPNSCKEIIVKLLTVYIKTVTIKTFALKLSCFRPIRIDFNNSIPSKSVSLPLPSHLFLCTHFVAKMKHCLMINATD